MREPSLFESYNARFLDPVQVGKGFIYSGLFDDVVPPQHSLLIGPRGSGKTTFLKMLTVPALYNWKHSRKKNTLERIDYIAIYVPSDFTWYPEFRRPINATHNLQADDLLSYGLFRSHVLLAICDTLEHLINPAYANDRHLQRILPTVDTDKLDDLAQLLIKSWRIDAPFVSFFSLRQAINERIRQLQYFLTMSSVKEISAEQLLNENKYLAEHFFDDLRTFADAFTHVFAANTKWAICFDEVEIAPSSVKAHILQSPRSFDQRFIVKCSASPFDEQFGAIFGPKMPMAAQDFTRILLSQVHQREVQRFSGELFRAICKDAGVGNKSPIEILGSSFFEDSFDLVREEQFDLYEKPPEPAAATVQRENRYSQGGFHFRKFASLSRKDQTFAAYLRRRGIEMTQMNSLPENLKAADIRKIISIVTVRDEFVAELAETSATQRRPRKLRSRKAVSEIYTGAHALFAICEGNPRWLIGLVRPLLEVYKEGKIVERSGIVQRAEQARRAQLMITQYLSLLSTITVPGNDSKKGGVLDTIDAIGEYFFIETVGGPFNSDPVLSFRIDEDTSGHLKTIVGAAMNQGAFVLIPSMRAPSQLGKIEGQRIRLTHLLAPLYRLPLVTGRQVSVSSIFSDPPATEEKPLLFDLFGAAQ
jgi:hypothetical protein